MIVHCDGQHFINLVDHQIYHKKTKHTNIRFNFMRDVVKFGEAKIEKIASRENLQMYL